MKKLLFTIICLLIAITSSAIKTNINGIYYILYDENKEAMVTYGDRYWDEDGDYPDYTQSTYDIPPTVTYEGVTYTVTAIDNEAFSWGQAFCPYKTVSKITIPNTVRTIGRRAFSGCYSLTSVSIGNSVTEIGEYAFANCGIKDFVCFAKTVPSLGGSYVFTSSATSNTLYVPKSSINAYKAAELWGQWKNVLPISLNLTDGENYVNMDTKETDELTFTKTFSSSAAGKWNAFYVPMNVNVEKYVGQLDFAKIYAFCATVDTNGDGIVDGNDENYLFVRPVKTGVLKPNVPYLVRPREAKTYVINSADNKLYPKTDGKVEFSTSRDNFTVTGLNAPFTVTAGDNNYYVSASGTLGYRTSGSTTVKANRWIMHRESKGYGSVNVSPTANSCRIIAIGEDMDETTAIETIKMLNEGNASNSSVYTLDGRKVNDVKTLSNGIYIKNGKKFIVK